MDALLRIGYFTTSTNYLFPTVPVCLRPRRPLVPRNSPFSAIRTSLRPEIEIVEEDVLQTFIRERQLNGDFISKASDMFWQREVVNFVDEAGEFDDTTQEAQQVLGSDEDGGLLKLSRTREWILGDNTAPINKKAVAKAQQDESDKRKILNLLQYQAIKRELILLSIGIGTACSGYCLLVMSVQAAVSYSIGVLFSCLYLQLLYQHTDNLSREVVPQIFRQKKSKKIGIRSEDLRDAFQKTIKGSSIALSSPRLVIPATIYGFWVLSHQYFSNDYFDFQLVPAMLGMFVYKAAALVQVYRDNENLQFVFPENEQGAK